MQIRAKKSKRYIDICASAAGLNDNYGTLFVSMLQSDAYKSLSTPAKQFYTLCRAQAQSETGRRCLYKHAAAENKTYTNNCFVFPTSHMRNYGIDAANGRRCIKELIAGGFIELIENNAHRKIVNVYCFCERWKAA